MITEKELSISNKSYTNKDFVQIYTEILTMAKELSNKFDPEASNESDPFIVLLKLLGFIGDKINYNVDKNILERFMPSATQESSMRELCDMMGYAMHYYVAPVTEVSIEYLDYQNFDETHVSFQLPRYTTIVTDNDAEINYVLLRNAVFKENQREQVGLEVMQGVLKDLTVLDSAKILLENLDENNRVYFNESMVAENGVFIEGGSNLVSALYGWRRVDNLNNQKINDSVYKVGYDSYRRLPYIEFPKDIANLIGDGLTIKYIITDGKDGNVRAKTLTKLNSSTAIYWRDANGNPTDDEVTIINSDTDKQPFSVTNTSASINGRDPETIDEAYNGFKKTIGTFDTLVTCRDYVNYIYRLVNDENNPLVSNIQVADRRTDINYGKQIVTYNQYGQNYVNESSGIDAFDLVLYPLKPLVDYSLSYFNDSFTQLLDTDQIKSDVEEAKSISHNYKDLTDTDIFALKNYYKLTANISTTHKVNEAEQLGILNNINYALVKKFNARNVDFGYEIPYDELLSVIENADERIKLVNLYEPELNTKVLFASTNNVVGDEVDLISSDGKNAYLKLLAKNILAGRYPLFNYDNKFTYDYGQQQISGKDMVYEDIAKFTSNLPLTLTSSYYTLKENEYVQLVSPEYVSDFTYPYGINYYLKLNERTSIPADTPYQLQANEICIFVYTNDKSVQVVDIYDTGKVIKSKNELFTFSYYQSVSKTPTKKTIEAYNYSKLAPYSSLISEAYENYVLKMYQLSQADEVEPVKINEQVLNKSQYCYWLLNNNENKLPFDTDTEYMLQNGEYFWYTDLGFTNLFSYGPGTLIKITNNWGSDVDWTRPKLDVAEVIENGLLKCKDKFELFQCTDGAGAKQITLVVQSIFTLSKGDQISVDSGSASLSNEFDDYDDVTFRCTLTDGSYYEIIKPIVEGGYLKGRTRLDLNTGFNKPQTVLTGQVYTFYDIDDQEIVEFDGGGTFQLSELRQISGGELVDIYTVNYLVIPNQNIYVDLYCYDEDTATGPSRTNSENYQTLEITAGSSKTFTLPSISGEKAYVMIYKSNLNGTISLSCPSGTIKDYARNSSTITGLSDAGIYTFELTNVSEITISAATEDAKLIISRPRYASGFNEAFNLSDARFNDGSMESKLIAEIRSLDANHKFYYSNYIDNSKIIESSDLSEPYALYDYNNIANKWTISEIDFNANEITIVRGSRA